VQNINIGTLQLRVLYGLSDNAEPRDNFKPSIIGKSRENLEPGGNLKSSNNVKEQ
jgi:hypothetical protein